MLSDKITIVVPCRNEEKYIGHLLSDLSVQKNIGNTKIIIADCSTDNTRRVIENSKLNLNVQVIDGGPVSLAKNNGAKLTKTPYILFIDADVRFFSNTQIEDAVDALEKNQNNLLSDGTLTIVLKIGKPGMLLMHFMIVRNSQGYHIGV